MASVAQIHANQKNAKKSTGPVSIKGKNKVSTNAVKHGVFSSKLILKDEDPAKYQLLLEQLQDELKPVGILEHSLVERMALSLWRQQRLVRAETAYIELERKTDDIVSAVNQELKLGLSSKAISKKDLTEFDSKQYHWCIAVLKEYETINYSALDIEKIKKSAPLIYQQIIHDAESYGDRFEELFEDYEGPLNYFKGLIQYCHEQIEEAEFRPLVLEVAELVKNKRSILSGPIRDNLARYQVMLDNEFYKAIKAFREAQEWRLKSLPLEHV